MFQVYTLKSFQRRSALAQGNIVEIIEEDFDSINQFLSTSILSVSNELDLFSAVLAISSNFVCKTSDWKVFEMDFANIANQFGAETTKHYFSLVYMENCT